MAATTATSPGYDELPSLLRALTGDEKHDWSSLSTLDVIWTLYDRVLRVDPERPDDPRRDRFLLSKGHGPTAYYAVLAAKGFIPRGELSGFASFDSSLGHHPDRMLVPGVEISSGSLGHGLPIAVGMALALDARDESDARIICLVGDAELEEGSNFEAIQLAGRLGLARLTVVVIDNQSSSHGWPDGIERRFAVEGWTWVRANGHDHTALEQAFAAGRRGRPHVVVAEVHA